MEERRERAWALRQEAKLLNEMANGIGPTSRQRKKMLTEAKKLKLQAHELETAKLPKWMIVFGPPGAETGFVESPQHPGKPGWTRDRAEAELLCPPGGRVVDANEFVKSYNERLARERT